MTLRPTVAAAAAAFVALALAGVLLRPLLPVDETRYVDVAWEMWTRGNWFVLTKNFAPYPDKPPLLFWMIDLVWLVTGVSELAARLVAPATALAAVLLTARLARRLWPEDAGVGGRAAIALIGLPVFALFGGLTRFDAMLAATAVAAILALTGVAWRGGWRGWVYVGLAIGAGVLTKGPVILVHVLPAIVTVNYWLKGRSQLTGRQVAIGTGIALLTALILVALWLVPALVRGDPAYREAILWGQTSGRVVESFAHARPLWWFAAMLPVILFPWGWMPGFWRAAWRAPWLSEPGLKLALVWLFAAFALFSAISGKQIHYIIPELPALALIAARLARDLERPSVLLPALPLAAGVALAVAASAGLVPLGEAETLLHPVMMLVGAGIVLAGVIWLGIALGGLTGGAALTAGTLLVLNLLVGMTATRQSYDAHGIAAELAKHQGTGVAFIGQMYHGEFNFAGRFTTQVATPESPEALTAWIGAHPEGVIAGRTDWTDPGWPARMVLTYRNAPYGIWFVADRPKGTSGS